MFTTFVSFRVEVNSKIDFIEVNTSSKEKMENILLFFLAGNQRVTLGALKLLYISLFVLPSEDQGLAYTHWNSLNTISPCHIRNCFLISLQFLKLFGLNYTKLLFKNLHQKGATLTNALDASKLDYCNTCCMCSTWGFLWRLFRNFNKHIMCL